MADEKPEEIIRRNYKLLRDLAEPAGDGNAKARLEIEEAMALNFIRWTQHLETATNELTAIRCIYENQVHR